MGVSYMWKSLSWTSVSTANAVFQVVMIWQGVTSWLLGSSSFIHNYMGGFVYYLTKLLWAGISVGSWGNSVSAQRGWARMWNLGGFFLWLLLLLCYSNPLWWICYFRLCWNANLKNHHVCEQHLTVYSLSSVQVNTTQNLAHVITHSVHLHWLD